MQLRNVLVSIPYKPGHEEAFRQSLPGAAFRFARSEELAEGEFAAFDAVVGNPGPEDLAKFTNLKLMQLLSSGVPAHFLTLRDTRPDAVLCSATGAYGPSMAEHMLAALLMLARKLHLYRDAMPEGKWENRGSVRSLRGMRALVVGAGSIGTEFARLMKLMGAYTVGVRRSHGPYDAVFDEMHTQDALDELLPGADVVALSVPHTPQTAGLMDARRFGLMKEGSYLLNVGRGSAVDQDALVDALRSGRLAGASIDVAEPEPLPSDHPLWREENLLITPHVSGFWYLHTTHDRVVDIACRNLQAYPHGPYVSRVDYETGYRAKED